MQGWRTEMVLSQLSCVVISCRCICLLLVWCLAEDLLAILKCKAGLLQEDAHLIEPAVGNDSSVGVFAVFDGHGGKEVATFAAAYLVCAQSSGHLLH
jgi:Protein phosphatase 2C